MDTKQWAVFFVALLSFDYAAATYFGRYKGVPKSYADDNDGYYGWSGGCRCDERLTSRLDKALENTKLSLGRYKNGCPMKDTNLEEYEFNNGHLKGIHKFERKGLYRCSLSRKYVRIIFKIGFFDLLIHYTVSIVEDIFGRFLGGIASFLGRILGKVSNFLFRIFIPDLFCTVVLIQDFEGSGGFKLEGLYLNEVEKISFSDKRFSKHQSYFRPLCDHVLRHTINDKFSGELTKHVTKVRADKRMFYYESNSGKRYGYEYEGYDESGGSYSYDYSESDSSYD